jgi:iron complex outermembrane recepter protein
MFKSVLMTALLLLSFCAFAQDNSISGVVKKSNSSQGLPGATVKTLEGKVAVTDEFGRFAFTDLASGEQTLTFSYVGLQTRTEKVQVNGQVSLNISLEESSQLTDEVVVYATRANENTPTTFTNVSQQTLQKQNFGQDLPILLNWTPSLVTTSDAGAGVGYTGLRIRGTDATRINVTINGIPYNDSESQGTFWVNIPDIASSTQSVQIQRGVGTSSNGAGSFGGSVNLQTLSLQSDAYAEFTAAAGSFNTQRYTVKAGTGLIKNRWAFDVRASKINSDGYIDRATSDLKSYYVSGGYYGEKTIVKAILFGGGERTYQAWYGLDAETMKTSRTFNLAGALLDESWVPTGVFYKNEVDDYKQDHYQLHISQNVNQYWNANLSFHYTYGRGFFEQYKQAEPFAELGLEDFVIEGNTISNGDVVVRRWLDNDFYGTTYSLNYNRDKIDLTVGGAYNEYANARHFGEIIWAQYNQNVTTLYPHEYYNGESEKTDFNIYSKLNYKLTEGVNAFVDLQYRSVSYETAGIDDNQSSYSFDDNFDFVNPKVGLSYQLSDRDMLYFSYAVANREPNRTDYVDGYVKPTSEHLDDFEAGWKESRDKIQFEANLYYMNYTNQLVLTGQLDDVGNPIRANVGKSFRTGVELSALVKLANNFTWNVNTTLSTNKNRDFVADESNLDEKKNTSIILSPSVIAGSQLTYSYKRFHAALLSKYVGDQYLDNTENDDLTLEAYLVNDIRTGYSFDLKSTTMDVNLLINNVTDKMYSSNGYSWGTTPYYFPQAGRNIMAMITFKI